MARDDERLVFVGLEELIGVGDGPGMRGIRDRAFCQIGIGALQAAANRFEADAVAVDEIGIDADADSGTRTAPTENLTDTFYLCKFLREDGIGGVINLRRGNIGRG